MCKLSPRSTISMKWQSLFPGKTMKISSICRLLKSVEAQYNLEFTVRVRPQRNIFTWNGSYLCAFICIPITVVPIVLTQTDQSFSSINWLQDVYREDQSNTRDEVIIQSKFYQDSVYLFIYDTAPDKRGYPHDIFFNDPQKHMLLVLIRSTSLRCF